jgi:chaperone required for assembly of F1-ATPase
MKRFWITAEAAREGEHWRVLLDGRGVKTAGGSPQSLPSQALAEAMAAEWAGQGETVDASAFVLRDLADFALDVVAPDPANAARELLPYAETDTLSYRGDPDEPLFVRQEAVWEPLLAGAEARWGVCFPRVSGIMASPLPPETRAKIAAILEAHDPFTIAALTMLASLAASLVIALEAIEPGADIEALWNAANLEEDWQAELWGHDAEAEARRTTRLEAFRLAARFAALARSR